MTAFKKAFGPTPSEEVFDANRDCVVP